MVLIFSKVQRCNVKGAPKGYYGYKEEFDAPAELAKQLVDANVAGYVTKPVPVPKEPEKVPEKVTATIKEQEVPEDGPVQSETPETPEVILDPTPKLGKKSRR